MGGSSEVRCIVVAIDGTGKKGGVDGEENTNVYRAGVCINNSRSDNVALLYLQGIATEGNGLRRFVNTVTGHETNKQIRTAYKHICESYRSAEDKIFLLGYSRGAFAVRCLADLIYKFGILSPENLDRLDDIFERWKNREDADPPVNTNMIKTCVLWDTVSSVAGRLMDVVDSEAKGAESFFHALALHERRHHYLPTVMKFPNDDTLGEQCWFSGYHGDIGGGRKKNALGNIALAWGLAKLEDDLHPNWKTLENDDTVTSWEMEKGEWILKVKDTFKGVFRALPISERFPKLQFWDGKMHITKPAEQAAYDMNSKEVFHSSVRYLLDHMRRTPKALKNAPYADARWTLYEKDYFQLHEAVVCQAEGEKLRQWLERNLRKLQASAGLGQPAPALAIAVEMANLHFNLAGLETND